MSSFVGRGGKVVAVKDSVARGAGKSDRHKALREPETVNIGGVEVTSLSRDGWGRQILNDCTDGGEQKKLPVLYTSANGNVLSLKARNRKFGYLMERFDRVDADGQSLVIASRLMNGVQLPERCATTDFFHDMAKLAVKNGLSFYLLGASEEVNKAAVDRMLKLYPGLNIIGRRNGYFMPDEELEVVEEINEAAPDILWVGMGVPHEHDFVVRYRSLLTNVSAIKTCGGLFDFLAEKNSRAPQWMQDAGFEWLYRLALEPRRLLWRYVFTNVHAIWLMVRSGYKARQQNSDRGDGMSAGSQSETAPQ